MANFRQFETSREGSDNVKKEKELDIPNISRDDKNKKKPVVTARSGFIARDDNTRASKNYINSSRQSENSGHQSSAGHAKQLRTELIDELESAARNRHHNRNKARRSANLISAGIVVVCLGVIIFSITSMKKAGSTKSAQTIATSAVTTMQVVADVPDDYMSGVASSEASNGQELSAEVSSFADGYKPVADLSTVPITSDEVISTYAVLIDADTNKIVASKNSTDRISPASMTKILTVLTAADKLDTNKVLDDPFTMTIDITDYTFSNDCSVVGFSVDEQVPIKDLFYGTILPSGADAAMALAQYTSGTTSAFVDQMNAKVDELGLTASHFTNPMGIYDEQNYTTCEDMAMIMKAAVENDFCRDVLSTHVYTTASTEQHPEGITVSNWFLRRIEDKETGGTVMCAKTGFVVQSGNCAASYFVSDDGGHYICVTGNAHSSWRAIYDHVAIYKEYVK